MGLGKRDLDRKRKALENKLKELEEKSRKNPLNKALQEEIAEFKKKLKE
jgi:ribosome-interacting GTPase 1